jgi:hypothetical protein
MIGVTILLLVGFWGTAQAQAGTAPAGNTVAKFALVIGNSTYSGYRRNLKNPANDSRLMAQNLRKLGFDVRLGNDLDRARMTQVVSDFADGLPEGATALVFYAGHGMQIGGASYLVPVDMIVTSEQSVPLRAYPLKTLLERLSASRSSVNLVVLDACRDNPFQPETPIRYRSFNNLGLARVQAPVGTVVAYSTSPGQLAADGQAANSVYTAALAEVMLEPGLSIEAMFKKVGVQVRNKTQDDQIPWFESSLSEAYFFRPPEGVSIVAGRRLPLEDDRRSQKSRRRAIGDPGDASAEASGDLWYRFMSEPEWASLDDAMDERVKRMTGDELALTAHKASGGSVIAQTTLGLHGLSSARPSAPSVAVDMAAQKELQTKAIAWLRMASNAGFPMAQTELASAYFTGHGVPRDAGESRRLLTLAAAANYPKARRELQAQGGMQSGGAEHLDSAAFNTGR